MQPRATTAATCPECGTRLEESFSEGLGRCMICLLRVGFDDAKEADDARVPPINERLGSYRIEHGEDGTLWELGRGAMGVTYRAVDTSLQRSVALKLIDPEWIKRGAEARERFMREARAAAALRHPNVATVYQFGVQEENGQYFCAMELVEGETLETRVRRAGPIDAATTIEIALQVSSALAAAEKQGLVHRDLKPGNLMLVESEGDASVAVKVIDFGVAKALSEKPDAMGLTHGGFVGTPAFASPEQFTNAPVDVRSDIYSLGATLWYLLTGRMPFPGASVEEIRSSQHLHFLPMEQLKAASVPRRFVSLIVSMLAAEPAARPSVRTLTIKLKECRAPLLDRWKTARRSAMVATLLGIAGAAVLLTRPWQNRGTAEGAAPANFAEKSIAVLPFDNLSQDANAYFATGMQDEILTHLAKIADLKVISRTSVMAYRAGPGRNLRQIGKELGVAHLLEGSVQRDAKRVRVNAQLIDARTDAHLWAQTYDRDLADVFAIQSEIAKTIADQLHARLSPTEKVAIEQRPTGDLVAFELYTRARTLRRSGSFSQFVSNTGPQISDLLDQAVARDPAFLLAWCELALEHVELYFQNYDHTPARLALADAAIEAVLRLRPDSGEAHLALAWHFYYGYGDYDRARTEVAIAQRTLPNDPRIFEVLAKLDRREGRWEESTRNFERVLELDPRNIHILQQMAISYSQLHSYAKFAAILDRALAIVPQDVDMRVARAGADFASRADSRPLHAEIQAILAENPGALQTVAYTQLDLALSERDLPAAERALAAVPGNVKEENALILSHKFGEGLVARVRGDAAAARAAFTATRVEQEEKVRAQPDYAPNLCVLGLIDAALGRKEDALREGRRAVELLPVARDSLNGPLIRQFFAITCAWVGEKDLALKQLEIAAKIPTPITYGELKLHPFWDPLRGDPRFDKIVATLAPKEVDLPEKSIAVLPFENRSDDKENAFFADAIQDDVLTSLVKIKELKVIGRASVMSYRDGTKRNLRDIGRELGVAHVLEGTVRRVADRMLIHVNLTDTRDGRAVWAERYERTMADFSRLQGELAIEIAGALRMKLAPETKASLELKYTDNPDAYVFYLRGREYQMRPETSQDNNLAAENFYKQAITLDPRFALAYARLAVIQNNLHGFFDQRPARIAEARRNAEEAVRLDPNCGQAHMALAVVTIASGGSPEEIKREIATAVRLLPNDAYIAMDAAMYQGSMGWFEEEVASYERAIVLNPRDGKIVYNYGVALYEHNERPRALWALERALELSPESVYFRVFRARVEIEWTGDVASAKAILAKLPKGKDPDGRATAAHCSIAVFERNFSEALRLLGDCSVDRLPMYTGFGPMVPKNYIKGLVQFYAGDREGAYATLDSTRWILEVEAREHAGETDAHFLLAVAYAAMGWADAAIAEAGRAKEKMDDNRMAAIFAHLREVEPVLSALERADLTPEYKNIFLRLEPHWDFVRQHPRFQKLLDQAAAAVKDGSQEAVGSSDPGSRP